MPPAFQCKMKSLILPPSRISAAPSAGNFNATPGLASPTDQPESPVIVPKSAKRLCLKGAARRLCPALQRVIHIKSSLSRDRAHAAVVMAIYGLAPFAGASNFRDVAGRYRLSALQTGKAVRHPFRLPAGVK